MVVFFILAVCRKLCLVGFSVCVCKGTTLLATQSALMVKLAYGVPLDLVWAQTKSFGQNIAKERLVQECGLACCCQYKAIEIVCMGRCSVAGFGDCRRGAGFWSMPTSQAPSSCH